MPRPTAGSRMGGALGLAAVAASCAGRPPCSEIACTPACPRDAARDATGRCVCARGDVLVLGACVPPAVGDAFCGRAARIGARGCAFRECGNDEALDVATGGCIPRVSLTHGGVIACGEGSLPVVESRQIGCVSLDATCPRGTDRVADVCVHGPFCPAGTLQDGTSCRPVVAAGGRVTGRRVDVGAWTALALGIDGGSGSAELCRPLAQRPGVFALPPGETATLRIRVALSLPDEDLSRLHADIQSVDAEGHPSVPPVEVLVSDAVGSMLEPLRALGGEASTAALHLEVRCTVGVLGGSPLKGSP